MSTPLFAAAKDDKLEAAADVLAKATESGQVRAASLYVRQGSREFARVFGRAKSTDDIFLLASISKTIAAAAVMKVFDQGKFTLDDPAQKYLPDFTGEGRETITMRQLLTHVSGLPDQLPENAQLRGRHAPLGDFVRAAVRTPLLFEPGTKYSYSSMAILLACDIAERLSGMPFAKLVDESVYKPLGMKRSAMGLGPFALGEVILNQVERAAPESGGGDASTKSWDWNSPYWRKLGAPWGGAHGSAADVGRFLAEFLKPSGKMLKPETARMMIANHNPEGLESRGLGFDVGKSIGGRGCSERTFGHGGSTGTLCWCDPASETIFVALTTLPLGAVTPHPCRVASDLVAAAVG